MKVSSNIGANAVHLQRTANNTGTSFRGFWNKVGSVNKGLMEHIEKGGFFAEFCIMDMCGLVLPRVYQGFRRNEKELGHLNYQAGTEEFLREFITGPSMFLIPIAAVILAGRRLGRGTQINSKLLTQFSDIFKNMGLNFARKENSYSNKTFAARIFDKFIKNQVPNAADHALTDYKIEFVNLLTNNVGKKLSNKDSKAAIGAFEDLVARINTSYFGKKEHTLALSAKNGSEVINTTASDLFLDARKYMEDVIPSAKLTFDELASKGTAITQSVYENTINGITKIRENGRKLLCLGGSAALAGFLSIIPKIYQISKKNPALNGIEDNKGGNK